MWYSASLFFKSRHPDSPENEFLWENSIILIEADNAEDAEAIATCHGQAAQHEYISALHERVQWTFERIDRIYEIDSERLSTGVEVFSRFLREAEVESLSTPFEDETTPGPRD
jgi:hypothetical protein